MTGVPVMTVSFVYFPTPNIFSLLTGQVVFFQPQVTVGIHRFCVVIQVALASNRQQCQEGKEWYSFHQTRT
jgi:hypothetical protein